MATITTIAAGDKLKDSRGVINTNFANLNAALGDSYVTSMIIMWQGTISTIPTGWVICDGNNSTPNLYDKFIRGAGNADEVGATGGEDTHELSVAELPSHDHGGSTSTDGEHDHTGAYDGNAGNGDQVKSGDDVSENTCSVPDDGDHSHTISAAGSGNSHENRPAFHELIFIMKT